MSELKPVDRSELDLLVDGRHGQPHAILGAHPHDGAVTIRVLKPLASTVAVRIGDVESALEHEHNGVWAGVVETDRWTERGRETFTCRA